MCLAVPAEVVSRLENDEAVVSLGGTKKTISIALTPEVVPGDYVIVHVGYALSKIDEAEARRTLALLAEQGVIDELKAELSDSDRAVSS